MSSSLCLIDFYLVSAMEKVDKTLDVLLFKQLVMLKRVRILTTSLSSVVVVSQVCESSSLTESELFH